ncbi:alcohol dehydrogenase catalytic domain-containing protein [Conyzicola lurida]|nr:zinc-binding dehydrogenase [Conyzicola lurida]
MIYSGPADPHRPLAVDSVDLRPGDALVEIELATVCGSDVHTVGGHRSTPTPTVLGHEQVGRVVALGDGAVRADGTALAIGDRVVWSATVSCGDCDRCTAGLTQKCRALRKFGHERVDDAWTLNGGFATHAHLPRGMAVVAVPDHIPADVLAPLACGTATAWAAVAAALDGREPRGLSLVVTGGGLIGLSAAAIASSLGARVTLADPDPARRDLATRFGASVVLDPTSQTAEPCDAAIEASGSRHAVAAAIDALDVGGVAALVGSVFPGDAVPLDPESIVRRLATVRGVHNYTPRHLVDAADWVAQHHDAFPFAELVGERFALAELDSAIALAAAGTHVRVAVSAG